jgi:hypothetical protein
MTHITEDVRSISRLFGDALESFSKLLQTEIRLARAELSQKASQAATGAGLLVGALLLLIPSLVLFLLALAEWLTELGLSPITSHALSGLVALILAGVLALMGMARLKPASLAPQATVEEVRRDMAAAKEMTS